MTKPVNGLPVLSTCFGIVTYVIDEPGWKQVEIVDENGLIHRYGNLRSICVKPPEALHAGVQIGEVTRGAPLHYDVTAKVRAAPSSAAVLASTPEDEKRREMDARAAALGLIPVSDPQASDREHRTQQDAMRATIARLSREISELQGQAEQSARSPGMVGHEYLLEIENTRLRKELHEAVNGRDAEFNRAEKEREQANEWLTQLTDANTQIAAARHTLGALTDESLEQVASRRMCFPTHNGKPFAKGTLAAVFSRSEPVTSKGPNRKKPEKKPARR